MVEALNILVELTAENVRYVLCGGLAVNIYGIPRVTADIDLVLDLEKDNINSFLKVLHKHNYIKSLPIELDMLIDKAIRKKFLVEKNLIAYSFHSTLRSVTILDVIVNCPYSFEEIWKEKETRTTSKGSIYLISINQLIGMKEIADRIQDKKDIEALLKLKK